MNRTLSIIATLLLLTLNLVSAPLPAQQQLKPAQMDTAYWQQAVDGRAYDEKASPKQESTMDFERPAGWDLGWAKYLMIAILLGLLIYFLVRFLSKDSNVKLAKDKSLMEAIETADEDISNTDLESLLQRALDQGEHRAALRIQYLILLKSLDNKGWISHRKDKTNMAYVHEMQGKEEGKEFRYLTQVFEYVWYGGQKVGPKQYGELAPHFSDLQERIQTA